MTPPPSRYPTGQDVFRVPPSRRPLLSRALRHADVVAVVSTGGALGSLARYGVGVLFPTEPGAFPWGTFLANLTGCLFLGVLMVFVTEVWSPGRYLRPFLGVGVLGGFTTFSTAAAETLSLGQHGSWLLTNVYVVGSVVGGLAAAWVGAILARLVTRRPLRGSR